MIPKECKRLAEIDFPIAAISRYAAREKSIRHGHPSTLHLWWARWPLASFTINLPPEASGNLYNTALSSLERELFRRVMTQTGGNLSRAAQILGLSRMTLRKRLAQYGLLANNLSLFDNLKTNTSSPKDSKR